MTSNHSGFWSVDSCIHQLLSIMHKICKAFDANPSLDVRGVFVDLSKAFDRVWHDGLMYKLKSLGICGNYYGLIHSFLSDRYQRVVLNGQSSNWPHIKAGVPQVWILPNISQMIPHFFSGSWFCSIFSISWWWFTENFLMGLTVEDDI